MGSTGYDDERIEMQAHELRRLKEELDGPRLSRRRSTLGIAVASAALGAFEGAPPGAARPRADEDERA